LEAISLGQYDIVYNAFSFAIAVMGAATAFIFLNPSQVAPVYRTAITITGLVRCIAYLPLLADLLIVGSSFQFSKLRVGV